MWRRILAVIWMVREEAEEEDDWEEQGEGTKSSSYSLSEYILSALTRFKPKSASIHAMDP